MNKQIKRIIARIMVALMVISVLPLDTWGSLKVVHAATTKVHNFDTDGIDSDSFYTISGKSGTVSASYELNGTTLNFTKALKMESSTSVSFNAPYPGDLLMIFDEGSNNKVLKVDAVEMTVADKLVSVTGLEAGNHEITKKDTKVNLCYIAFTYEGGGSGPATVNQPTVSPAGGEFTEETQVTITADEGASIYYTLDGSTPNAESGTPYEAPITLNESVTLTAIAVKDGTSSEPVSYVYTITIDETAVKKPTAVPEGGEVEAGTTVTLTAEDYDSIRYTLDDSADMTTTDSGILYEGPVSITQPVTLRAIAVKGDKVSSIASFTYTLKLGEAPVASVTSGTAVEKGTEVKLTAAGADAIWYTVDGADPAADGSTVQKVDGAEAAVTVNEAVTIKAVAVKNGAAGKLLEASYTILKVAKPAASKTGSVAEGTEITLTSATAGAVIYYTMGKNAAEPDVTSNTTPHGASPVKITITEDTTVKAIAVKDKYDNSEMVTFEYKIVSTTGIETHVLDPDAIIAKTGESKYEYATTSAIDGTDGWFTAVAKSTKKASINKIADLRRNTGTDTEPVYEYYYPNLSWDSVDLSERTYAAVITGGAIAADSNAIKFTTQAYATGVVYYSLKEVPKNPQNIQVRSSTDGKLDSNPVASTAAGDNTAVGKFTFTLTTPGTYYVGFSGSGGIIPYMEITEDFNAEPGKEPTPEGVRNITVSDSTSTIIDAEFVDDADFFYTSDEKEESADVLNILLKAESLAEDSAELAPGIKKNVADQMEILSLESGHESKAYYYNLSFEDKDKTTDNALTLKDGAIKFEVSYEKLGITSNRDSLVVLYGSEIVDEDKITRNSKTKSFWVEAAQFSHPYTFIVNGAKTEQGKLSIVNSYGYEEGACAEWQDYTAASHDGYVAYVSTTPVFPNNDKTQRIDNELIRKYDDCWRVDTVGLKAGTYYIKVDAVTIDETTKEPKEVIASNTTGPLKVTNYDRSGFAFSKNSTYKTGSGAYNDDGTLGADAQVFYITKDTAKTVTCDVQTEKNKIETITGFQSIIEAKQKGYDKRPFDFRIIGCVKISDLDKYLSSSEGLQVKGKNANAEMNITIEGIGEDAAIHGFGMLLRNCGNVELRNFAIMAFMDDGISLDTDNCNIWVHDLDIFYGATGGDADQAKGDGSIDVKGNSTYVTLSYNHFWDSGKSSLCGMEAVGDPEFMVTYHHNWFDHSDSRHPRIRRGTIHVYNNYYDGNAKYGVGVTNASSAFVEANYFRNTKCPMLISKQGSDMSDGKGTFSGEPGGMIKAYNNKIEQPSRLVYANSTDGGATGTANDKQFDAYLASTRDEQVPDTYAAALGGSKYNNFDTSEKYDLGVTPANIDNPNNVKSVVTAKAGRLNGGDFAREGYEALTGAGADTNYGVDAVLKAAVVNYVTSVRSIGGINGVKVSTSGSTSTAVNPISPSGINAPSASVPSGTYEVAQQVTLSADAGMVIYYTTDGSNPADKDNAGRTKFETAIPINRNTIVKAIAVSESNGAAVDSSEVVRFTYMISSDMTPKYKISVYITREDSQPVVVKTIYAGDELTKEDLSEYTRRDGYIFKGWVDAAGNEITLPCTPASDMTFIADWEEDGGGDNPGDDTMYTVTIDLGYTGAPAPTTQDVKEGNSIDSPVSPTRDGYIFKGWINADTNVAVTFPLIVNDNITIKAVWEEKQGGDANHYMIYVNRDNGSEVTPLQIERGSELTEQMLPTPVRTGYTFKGWVIDDAAQTPIELPYTPQKDMDIKALWEKNETSGNKENWSVVLEKDSYTYTGSAIKPEFTVYGYDGKVLVEGSDYKVKYSNNTKASVKADGQGNYTLIDKKKVPTLTISGKGIMNGKETVEFEIKPKDISGALSESARDTSVAVGTIIIETGKKVTAPVICYNGIKLTAKDYVYVNADDKTNTKFKDGDTLNIKGQGNFEGELAVPIKVVAKGTLKNNVNKFKVDIDSAAMKKLLYTGQPQAQDIIACIKAVTPSSGADKGKNILSQTTKYAVVLPNNVTDAGNVKFMVVGLDEYSGCTVSKSVKIQPKSITGISDTASAANDKVSISGVGDCKYTGSGAVLSNLEVKWNNTVLTNGRDYKLTYSGNKKVGTAKYNISFKGNFKGKVSGTFEVKKEVLDTTNVNTTIEVNIPDKVCKDNASCKSTPYVTINGVLVKASEYDVTYSVGDADGTYNAKPKVTFGSDASKTVYVKIKAKAKSKNYTTANGNDLTGQYTVWKKDAAKKDLSKAKITFYSSADCNEKNKVTKFEYSGANVVPSGVKVTIGKDTTNYAAQCDIIYVNNVNKGKATVIVKPKANSGLIGGKTATFSVVAKNASGLDSSTLGNTLRSLLGW